MARQSGSGDHRGARAERPAIGSATHRAAGNALVSATAQVLGKVATLLWTLVAARELAPREFGHFTFVLATALLLSAVAEWGFDQVLIRRASAHLAELPHLLGRVDRARCQRRQVQARVAQHHDAAESEHREPETPHVRLQAMPV